MAYVRKTETLVREILGKVKEMSTTAQEPYQTDRIKKGTPEYDALTSVVADVSWKETPDLKNKAPSSWNRILDCGEVTAVLPNTLSSDKEVRIDLTPPEGTKFFMSPAHISTGYYRSGGAKVKFSPDDVPAIVKNWFSSKAEKDATRKEIAAKFDGIKDKLEQFMSQHASLNAALKDLPSLEMYVPSEYMRKIAAASAPRNAPKVERTIIQDLDIDVAELTTAAVAHRFAAAKQA